MIRAIVLEHSLYLLHGLWADRAVRDRAQHHHVLDRVALHARQHLAVSEKSSVILLTRSLHPY